MPFIKISVPHENGQSFMLLNMDKIITIVELVSGKAYITLDTNDTKNNWIKTETKYNDVIKMILSEMIFPGKNRRSRKNH
jgi:hypothetical protein